MTFNTEVSKQLSRVGFYIMLFVIFRTLFSLITPYYLYAGGPTPVPIDAHATSLKYFFDAGYVQQAKDTGYNHAGYFKFFIPLDLIFPLIYTSLFLSLLQLYKKQKIYAILKWLIIAGCAFDYSENISFSMFLLLKGTALAPVVAFFTTVKTCLFVMNIFVFLVGILIGIVLLLKPPDKTT